MFTSFGPSYKVSSQMYIYFIAIFQSILAQNFTETMSRVVKISQPSCNDFVENLIKQCLYIKVFLFDEQTNGIFLQNVFIYKQKQKVIGTDFLKDK